MPVLRSRTKEAPLGVPLPRQVRGRIGLSFRSSFALGLFVGALSLFLLTLPAAEAVVEVGLLTWNQDQSTEKVIAAFVDRLKDLHGEVLLLRRDSGLSAERFQSHMEEFRRRGVACAVVMGSRAARMAREGRWWRHFPLVASAIADPHHLGLDESLSAVSPDMTGVVAVMPLEENLSLLKYLSPAVSVVGFVYDGKNPDGFFEELVGLSPTKSAFGLYVRPVAVERAMRKKEDFIRRTSGIDAFLVGTNRRLSEQAVAFSQWAEGKPVFALFEEGVASGAVAGLYVDPIHVGQETARLVAAVLGGERASSLPYVFCSETHFAVNLASARRLGIAIPRLMMVEPSRVWRSSNGMRWYADDGSLLPSLRIENDPESRSYRSIGLLCSSVLSNRSFIEGVVTALRQSRSNYDLMMTDVDGPPRRSASLLSEMADKADLVVAIGDESLKKALDFPPLLPIVFTGAGLAGFDVLPQDRPMTGSTFLLAPKEHPPILKNLFGRDRTFILALPFPSTERSETDNLYREMTMAEMEMILLPIKSVFDEEAKARLMLEGLVAASRGEGRPVLIVPSLPEVYRALPALGRLMKEREEPFPVYVTSAWVQEGWGGTVAPDIAPEDVGLAAGKYVIQVLEQGATPEDLPLWSQEGTRSIRLHRRWREISRWTVPPGWGGGVKEVILEGDLSCR